LLNSIWIHINKYVNLNVVLYIIIRALNDDEWYEMIENKKKPFSPLLPVYFDTLYFSWNNSAEWILYFNTTNQDLELLNLYIKNKKHVYLLFSDYLKYFFKKYIYTINHKRIAINYMYFSMFSGFSGMSLATMIRIELSYPGSHFFKGDSIRYLQVITAHGLIMVFFVVVPLIFGFFANFFIPFHVGSKDVSFPRINSFGFWILFCGYILLCKVAFFRKSMFNYYDNNELNLLFFSKKLPKIYNKKLKNKKNTLNWDLLNSFIVENKKETTNTIWHYLINNLEFVKKKYTYIIQCSNSGFTMTGWTFITPFSSKIKYTGFGSQDIAVISVIFAGVTTTLSLTNLLITRRVLSMPGLKNKKSLIPFLSISLFLTMRMLALITPVLGAAMIMLELDRHWNTSFFDYTYGGDAVLFHHLFWFFGHPEVYVVIIPGFGIINMVLPNNNFRRIASKNHLIWATYIMAYMGFLVWGHHMYLIGLDHKSRSFYSTITIMISLPAVVKIVNWTLTLLNGVLIINTQILFAFSFILFFLSGGLTGMWLSHVGLNIYVHDTFYVVAHFHFMFSASTFSAIFCGIYYYYNVIFGVKYSKFFSYVHWLYWTIGQWVTFLPLYYVGYNGLPRRYHDFPHMYLGWQSLSTLGHLITIFSIVFFMIVLFDSKLFNLTSTSYNFFLPRLNKRITYYIFKIKHVQFYNKKFLINYLQFKKLFNN